MFKRLFLTSVAFMLVSCATVVPPDVVSVPPAAVSLKTADEKALIAAEATFQAVLIAVNAAVDSGQLKGENAARVGQLLTQAKGALDQARRAYDVGANVSARLSEFNSFIAGVRATL